MPTIVLVSDTHGRHHLTDLPPGDVLIHAGDVSMRGTLDEVRAFDDWLGRLAHRYRHKVVIAGNHDFCFQEQPAQARSLITNAHYLEDEATEVAGLRIYGSPWQPWFGGWAFNRPRGPDLAAVWANIPDGIDVLVTHGPPHGILDETNRGDAVGCRDLYERVVRVRPRLHVFGHIHEAAGRVDRDGITFVNAATQQGDGAGVVFEWPG